MTTNTPTQARVDVPGSKSYTNRALLMAAMTTGEVSIAGALRSDDTAAMISCLRALGIKIDDSAETIRVLGSVADVADSEYTLDANLSGITIRFLLALSCVLPGVQLLLGGEGLNKRPIGDLVDGLRQLGAKIDYLGVEGFPPLRVLSSKLSAGTVKMSGAVSSQYFSALLMIAPLIEGKVTLEVLGEQISKPYIDMTIDTMEKFGVRVSNHSYSGYSVDAGQAYTLMNYTVEGDISSASYFFALAALTYTTITVGNVNPQSKQADMQFLHILETMGSTVRLGDNTISVTGAGVRAVSVNMEDCPDQAMTMAVLAAFADGTSVISGVRSLRVKETERVVAVEQELAKMGIKTRSSPDTLTIDGGQPHAASINTYGDHRMAMSFALASAVLPDLQINNPEVVSKTFPGFWAAFAAVAKEIGVHDGNGADTTDRARNVYLIGMRGGGKTTVGTLLARALSRRFVDLDSLVVEQSQSSIPDLVAAHGWDFFRDKESAAVRQVCAANNMIVATGGGVVLRAENVELLKRSGLVILLTAPPQTLAQRIGDDPNRPALTSESTLHNELVSLWGERQELYERTADASISTDGKRPRAVVDEIIAIIQQQNPIGVV